MAFGLGVNTKEADDGPMKGRQIEIACKCWFTSTGRSMPMMIKFEDEGRIEKIDEIHVNYIEEKRYNGIASVEYDCTVCYRGIRRDVKLVFFKDECRWVMKSLD